MPNLAAARKLVSVHAQEIVQADGLARVKDHPLGTFQQSQVGDPEGYGSRLPVLHILDRDDPAQGSRLFQPVVVGAVDGSIGSGHERKTPRIRKGFTDM